MSVVERDLSTHVIQAFPPWLDLPPGYIVNDWIAWQKGKLVARRLREHPEDVQLAISWLRKHEAEMSGHDAEWLLMLETWPVEKIAALLESPGEDGQRLRSGTPFKGQPFVTASQMEEIRERAWVG
ncbi:MAG: hypothetical protein IAE77_27825 [Prosthecobacter sp.]|uniref:hypothetical protein n=1 Tax=Prosthecobacter sp. TaxID=1965333 RepID=UPI001A04A5BA|nr:hypothetical protein [Prosthecobacter sp.]MBE2287295.1 hypothetical protein [Prosthecobacter sp.]